MGWIWAQQKQDLRKRCPLLLYYSKILWSPLRSNKLENMKPTFHSQRLEPLLNASIGRSSQDSVLSSRNQKNSSSQGLEITRGAFTDESFKRNWTINVKKTGGACWICLRTLKYIPSIKYWFSLMCFHRKISKAYLSYIFKTRVSRFFSKSPVSLYSDYGDFFQILILHMLCLSRILINKFDPRHSLIFVLYLVLLVCLILI